MSPFDFAPEAVTAILEAVAAEEIMPLFRRLAAHQISDKLSGETVTEADLNAEKRLAEALTALLPGSVVLGEEGAAADPGLFSLIDGADPVWIVDPLDGTQNFTDGKDRFAVMAALWRKPDILAGWIHDPINRVTAWAVAGQGAWIGKTRLKIAPARAVARMTGSAAKSRRERLEKRAAEGKTAPTRIIRYRCVGREYLDLAQSVLDFAEYGLLKPWDHAAGVLIHREAGGFGAMLDDGTAYVPGIADVPGAARKRRMLLAPDETSWRILRDLLEI